MVKHTIPTVQSVHITLVEHNYNGVRNLSVAICQELDFCKFFKVDESQIQSIKTNQFIQGIKFVCSCIQANFSIKVSHNFKIYLSASAHHLVHNRYKFKAKNVFMFIQRDARPKIIQNYNEDDMLVCYTITSDKIFINTVTDKNASQEHLFSLVTYL